MIFLHIVLAICVVGFSGAFIAAQWCGDVTDNSSIALGFMACFALLIFGLSFLK
jgi:hypothetical protein